MANSRGAQLQWDIIEAMTTHGWMAGTAGGYDRKGEYVSELELTHYHLTKREEKRLVLEETEGDYLLNLAPNQAVLLVWFIDVL
nr:hypothetical protein [uncultured Halomonas sp.]